MKGREPQEVTKEIVGIHVLLSRSLFGDDIPRRLLRHVSLAKPTATGQHLSHFIVPDGPYTRAYAALAATGLRLNWESRQPSGKRGGKTKFSCPPERLGEIEREPRLPPH